MTTTHITAETTPVMRIAFYLLTLALVVAASWAFDREPPDPVAPPPVAPVGPLLNRQVMVAAKDQPRGEVLDELASRHDLPLRRGTQADWSQRVTLEFERPASLRFALCSLSRDLSWTWDGRELLVDTEDKNDWRGLHIQTLPDVTPWLSGQWILERPPTLSLDRMDFFPSNHDFPFLSEELYLVTEPLPAGARVIVLRNRRRVAAELAWECELLRAAAAGDVGRLPASAADGWPAPFHDGGAGMSVVKHLCHVPDALRRLGPAQLMHLIVQHAAATRWSEDSFEQSIYLEGRMYTHSAGALAVVHQPEIQTQVAEFLLELQAFLAGEEPRLPETQQTPQSWRIYPLRDALPVDGWLDADRDAAARDGGLQRLVSSLLLRHSAFPYSAITLIPGGMVVTTTAEGHAAVKKLLDRGPGGLVSTLRAAVSAREAERLGAFRGALEGNEPWVQALVVLNLHGPQASALRPQLLEVLARGQVHAETGLGDRLWTALAGAPMRDPNDQELATALRSLAARPLESAGAMETLLLALLDRSPLVRRTAAEALAQRPLESHYPQAAWGLRYPEVRARLEPIIWRILQRTLKTDLRGTEALWTHLRDYESHLPAIAEMLDELALEHGPVTTHQREAYLVHSLRKSDPRLRRQACEWLAKVRQEEGSLSANSRDALQVLLGDPYTADAARQALGDEP